MIDNFDSPQSTDSHNSFHQRIPSSIFHLENTAVPPLQSQLKYSPTPPSDSDILTQLLSLVSSKNKLTVVYSEIHLSSVGNGIDQCFKA